MLNPIKYLVPQTISSLSTVESSTAILVIPAFFQELEIKKAKAQYFHAMQCAPSCSHHSNSDLSIMIDASTSTSCDPNKSLIPSDAQYNAVELFDAWAEMEFIDVICESDAEAEEDHDDEDSITSTDPFDWHETALHDDDILLYMPSGLAVNSFKSGESLISTPLSSLILARSILGSPSLEPPPLTQPALDVVSTPRGHVANQRVTTMQSILALEDSRVQVLRHAMTIYDDDDGTILQRHISPRAPSSKPRKKVPVMSVYCPVEVKTRAPESEPTSSSSGALDWAENPWEETAPVTTLYKRGPKVVDYCDKPGQFWPDGQEPPFKGQKQPKHIFITKGKCQPRKDITHNHKEINWLKDDVQVMQSFHPQTGDVHLYHDYSDYDGSNEDDFFESTDDDYIPPRTTASPVPPPTTILVPVTPSLPSTMIVHIPVGKWMDIEDNSLDPDDLDLLSEIMEIPPQVYYKLLPVSDTIVMNLLEFKLPNIDVGCFTQTAESSFDRAHLSNKLQIPTVIPPKAWVNSLAASLNQAIWDGKRSIPNLNTNRCLSGYWLSGRRPTKRRRLKHYGLMRTNESDIVIVDTELPDAICLGKMNFDSLPSALEWMLAQGKLLFFPACIPEISHFVAFSIDFRWKELCYGDSLNLGAGQFKSFIEKIQRWLTARFNGPFKDRGNTLPHAVQQDSVSCGLFALNTITHNVFSTTTKYYRMYVYGSSPSSSFDTFGQLADRSNWRRREKRKDKADSWAAEVARLKKEKEMQEQSEIETQKEVEWLKEVQRMEVEQLEEIERQKELECEHLKCEHLEMERKKEFECKRLEQAHLKQHCLQRERLHQESPKATQCAPTEHVVLDDSMDIDIEPGEIASNPITRVRYPSLRHACAPFVAHRSCHSISPPCNGPSYPSQRPLSPTRPSTYRHYALSQFDHVSPARRRHSPSPDWFACCGRSPSPVGARGYHRQTTCNYSPVQRSRRTPSPCRGPATDWRLLNSGRSAHVTMLPPTTVPTVQPSILGTLALPMGFLQFLPSSTITTIAGFNRMGSRPVQNNITHFIFTQMSCLLQNDDPNPLYPSLHSDPRNWLLNITRIHVDRDPTPSMEGPTSHCPALVFCNLLSIPQTRLVSLCQPPAPHWPTPDPLRSMARLST
ncbi:hypothetical protein BDR04DRAFT_1163529 [Suillus decipiens]|nr:hypothetical protein BDR04DRAFT_1163529 [Suillus decipiens]